MSSEQSNIDEPAHSVHLQEKIDQLEHEIQQLQRELVQTRQVAERATVQATRLNQSKAHLCRNINHEIRSPLSTILLATALLEKQTGSGEVFPRQKLVRQVNDCVNRITQVLNQLHLFHVMTVNSPVLKPVPLDLIKLCETIVCEIQLECITEHLVDFISDGEKPASVYLDAIVVRRILTELLTNAVRYSPIGAMIYLRLVWQADQVLLQITDTGIGIPPEEHALVFEEFYRASNVNRARVIAGMGLGLTIVKELVELHRGSISLESKLEQGTTVSVCLPFNLPHQPAMPEDLPFHTDLTLCATSLPGLSGL